MTKSSADMKEVYGKMKKDETALKEEKPPRSKMLPLGFNSVAFPKVDQDRLFFFKTHVKPGTA